MNDPKAAVPESASAAGAYFDPAYFDWQAERAYRAAQLIVPLLLELAPGATSAVDLGCGTGAWLQVFQERGGSDVLGVDGFHVERDRLRIPPERFVAADLSALPSLDRSFDLALCLEAAHYAAPASAPGIVRWLTAAAPVVYFSAAIPNQTGGPGLNRQWPAYWSSLFAEEGFWCHDVLRLRLWADPRLDDWWYAQNGLVFARDGLPAPYDATTDEPLALVHPELFSLVADASMHPAAAKPRGLAAAIRTRWRRES